MNLFHYTLPAWHGQVIQLLLKESLLSQYSFIFQLQTNKLRWDAWADRIVVGVGADVGKAK